MTDLVLHHLAVILGGKTRLHPLSATIKPGQIVAVVGANGAGKSTLLRAIAALVPVQGKLTYDSQVIATLPAHHRAQVIGYMPQSHVAAWSMPVRDMVALGRYAFGAARPDAQIAQAVDATLATCGITDLADRPIDRLSGGEQALAALARVFVTQCPVMLLDEPVAALDIGRQYAVMEQVARLAAGGRTMVIVLHDLALVAQFSQRILWLKDGHLVADTENSAAALKLHAPKLLGRAPNWSADGEALYFSR